MTELLNIVKLALRITTSAFDAELRLLICACLEEMEAMNVLVERNPGGGPTSSQVQSAVVAYCKWQFGNHEDKDQWEQIYHTKLAQLKTMTGFTDWRDAE